MKLYAYCLSDDITAEAIRSLQGIAGGQVMLFCDSGIRAVVSYFEPGIVELSRDNVFAHERVNRGVLAHSTPLPFRFGTVVDEPHLAQYLATHKVTLLDQLARMRDCVEMSVKILAQNPVEEPAALDPGVGASSKPTDSEQISSPGDLGPGAQFLAAKRRAIEGEESQKRWADDLDRWLGERLRDCIRQSSSGLRPGARCLFGAAHLVERTRLDDYAARIAAARREREGIHFLTSGPWPPYSFTKLSC